MSLLVQPIIGRSHEIFQVRACLKAKKNVLLEGPVGVGKTHLALVLSQDLKRPVFRVDGDNRYSEQKLSGWFDPPEVLKKGFTSETFVPGPLVEAMQKGGILFINELNRLPEGVQNILLPAIDERLVIIPRLGQIQARDGFLVIATQNPKEFVATSHLSEAILDRFELVILDYQTREEEKKIVFNHLKGSLGEGAQDRELVGPAVELVRLTRNHPRVKRGASIRAAISIVEIARMMMQEGKSLEESFLLAVLISLPTRIEIELEGDSEKAHRSEVEALLKEWVAEILKKKS